MSEIKRITDPKEGPLDGVSLEASCMTTSFSHCEDPKQRVIESQGVLPCVILASYNTGALSISVRELDLMLTIRLDELFAVVKVAADAAIELKAEEEGGLQ